jgi:hypothetical protein
MADKASKDTRNPTTGLTAQEQVDKWQQGPVDGGAKGPLVPKAPVPQNTHPSAKGVYGSPIDPPLVK